jgi:hypothetical protein
MMNGRAVKRITISGIYIMKYTLLICFTGILLQLMAITLLPDSATAQTVGEHYRIETLQGNVFMGIIVSHDEDSVVLSTTELGEITIERVNIRSIKNIGTGRMVDGQYWFENPQSTRYFFATNARGLKKGHWYYQNTWIFFNNVNAGVTDNISLGVGIIPLFLFGSDTSPVWIMPKVSIPIDTDNFYLAAGGLFGGLVGEHSESLGFAYGVATIGSSDKNLSVGLGYGYAGSDWSNTPFVNVSGMVRVARRTYVLTENYFFSADSETFGLLSFGIRYAPELLAVDFGLIRPTHDSGGIIGIPWLGITIPFGRD